MRLSRLPNCSLILLLCFSLVSGGCAGSGSAAPSQPEAVAEAFAPLAKDDPFADDDSYDYLTQPNVDGQVVVGDDYFDDDDHLDDYSAQVIIPDPLEPWNRFWFKFNDIIIEYAARPVSKAYDFVVPEPGRKGLRNFFHNLRAPVRIVNCILQGKGREAGVEFSSFFLNTTAGFGGLFDIASQYRPKGVETEEDLGQTLGVWGMGEGIYLVWPLLGPSNVRDTVGMVGDYAIGYFTNPINYFENSTWTTDIAINALSALNSLSDIIKAYDTFKDIAIDPYSSMRDGFTQLRRSRIAR